MSRTTGSKRKLATVAEPGANVNQVDVDTFLQSVDAEIDSAIAKIKEGTHMELIKRSEALNRAKENKMAAADRHRKMQIKNITALYEYELEDANALFKKAYGEVQDEMIQDLTAERTKLKNAHKAALLAKERQNGSSSYLSDANQLISKSMASIGSLVPNLNLGQPAQNGTTNGTAGRSMRSKAPDQESDYVSADSKLEQLFSSRPSSSSLNALMGTGNGRSSRRKVPTTSNGQVPLDQVLSESSMRSDFLEIVRDLQARAQCFERTKPKALNKEVSLNPDYSELTVGSEVYSVGDLVNVFSVLSGETFSGVVSAIAHNEIIVKIGTGDRFSFSLPQLESGRVVLSRDSDMEASNEILRSGLRLRQTQLQQQQQQGIKA